MYVPWKSKRKKLIEMCGSIMLAKHFIYKQAKGKKIQNVYFSKVSVYVCLTFS